LSRTKKWKTENAEKGGVVASVFLFSFIASFSAQFSFRGHGNRNWKSTERKKWKGCKSNFCRKKCSKSREQTTSLWK
jgi:hypothetical protein